MTELGWKIGIEVELLAPAGLSRRDLARALASEHDGTVQRIFYPQSEPSLVPGKPVFESLTLGFEALDQSGKLVARCVDDITIQADLNRSAAVSDGWYRIVSDDPRLLRLIARHCNPDAGLADVLEPAAALFGSPVTREDATLFRLSDRMRAPIALAAGLPGERERVCELITPPLEADHRAKLGILLSTARRLGFTVPAEAAVHLHFDGQALRSPAIFARLVQTCALYQPHWRRLMDTNPRCIRLGPIPDELVALTRRPEFLNHGRLNARRAASAIAVSKYCDFNLRNLIHDMPDKPTFEVRILPGSIDADAIIAQARLFTALLRWCLAQPRSAPPPISFDALLNQFDLPVAERQAWRAKAAKLIP
jgi:hypothetical protein